MNKWKRICGVALTAALVMGMMAPSYAAKRKKITTVAVRIEAEIELGSKYGDENIEVEVKGKNYTYDYYEIENFGFEWMEEDVPEITIYLRADEGYYFSLTKASAVKVNGATYVQAAKQDSGETFALRVKLPPMSEMMGDETEVTLGSTGYAQRGEIRGAGSYELRLYRNGSGIGATYQSTDQLFYDYTSLMNKPGSYQVKVRAVNKANPEKKGGWMESEPITVSEEMAQSIRSGSTAGVPMRGDWKEENGQWKYIHEDGSCTKNDWEEINNEWYFFNEDGVMQTGWVEWKGEKYYCMEGSGKMLKGGTTPDGYLLDSDGRLKND